MIDINLIKKGTVIRTADLRKRTVDHIDGKYIHFTDGSCYGFRHPDLMEIVSESAEEPAPKKKSSKKKKESDE